MICFFEGVRNWFPPFTPTYPISMHSPPISNPLIAPPFTSPICPFYSIPPSFTSISLHQGCN